MEQLNYFKMKNLFFALAFMLMGTFAFAENTNYDVDVLESMGICTVTITEQNSDGTTNTYTYQFETSTAQGCQNAGQAILQAHINKR